MAATQKVALIFGGSGIIGSGVIKALLDNPKAPKIVTVARSPEKMESIKQKFGNLPEDKLIVVEGNVDSEENAAKLKDDILAKTKCITDVLSCMGRLWQKGPLLDASLSEFKEMSAPLNSHFVVAKTFLPLIADTEGSSFTFVTGGLQSDDYVPNLSVSMIYGIALLQLGNYVRHEWDSKPVRINEVGIATYVTPEASAHSLSSATASAGIAGVMVNSDARGRRFLCVTEEDFNKLAQNGTH